MSPLATCHRALPQIRTDHRGRAPLGSTLIVELEPANPTAAAGRGPVKRWARNSLWFVFAEWLQSRGGPHPDGAVERGTIRPPALPRTRWRSLSLRLQAFQPFSLSAFQPSGLTLRVPHGRHHRGRRQRLGPTRTYRRQSDRARCRSRDIVPEPRMRSNRSGSEQSSAGTAWRQ